LAVLDEFRDLVKALHRAGIEVILDVVFNHTAEGNHLGPTLCYRGLANEVYYLLEPDRAFYANYSGCGNTLNANQSIVRRLIVDSLRYWVEEMHVDGFRFDLASILSRDEKGHPLENPPVLWDIESEPVLAGTKLIAEAWDAAGLYQVGRFVGDTWKEWNGRFRDDIRAFLKGDPGTVTALAHRFLASPDLYQHKEREVEQSINFVTCHDGFTLNDLVSYNHKHNEANGEENRDGSDHNLSWNCGVEGPTDDPEVESLRNRQVKNFLALTLLSFGTPMLLMGDEVRRSQQGNNNAYGQDNDISWFDWSLVDRHRDVHRFVKELIRLRLHFDMASREYDLTLSQVLSQGKLYWHGIKLHQPDWSADSRSLAFTGISLTGSRVFHLICNAYWEALSFELPPLPEAAAGGWRRLVDTAIPFPGDICVENKAVLLEEPTYLAQPRSVVLLFSYLLRKEGDWEDIGELPGSAV
jgi:glycogen operon protein